jgi:transcriptional regulator with XRE-family HTH domain
MKGRTVLNVGLRLKLFRISADLKQREVADKMGVTVNYVSMLERGERDPTLEYLKSFSRLVTVPVSVLLWEPTEEGTSDDSRRDIQLRLAALMAEYAKFQGVENLTHSR